MTRFAIAFPGQGSQSVGMLAELAEQHAVIKETFAEASQVLGYDLFALVMAGPAEDLNKTWRTQPALLTASVALWRLWQQQGGATPAVMAGHSLGEYSALVCAGVLDFADAVKLVEQRGIFMQDAVPLGSGGMAAILGLDDAKVRELCAASGQGEVVAAVNYNSPGQVVIAGHAAAVARASEACKAAGAKRALPLPVSAPSHCELMKPAAERLAVLLAGLELKAPQVPVVNNVDVASPSQPAQIRDALVRQLYLPVRWTESIEKLSVQGVHQFVEVGPGKVLGGLIKRISKEADCLAVSDSASLDATLQILS